MSKCPNINSPEWKELVSNVGETRAWSLWFLNGSSIPATYEQRQSNQESIRPDEFEWQKDKLGNAFNADIIYDDTLSTSATVQTFTDKRNVIKINPNKLFKNTLIHEYSHIFIDGIGGFDNPIVKQLYNQVKDSARAKEIREIYSDKTEETIKKEIVSDAIDSEGTRFFYDSQTSLLKRFKNSLELFWNRIKQVFGLEADYAKILAGQMLSNDFQLGSLNDSTYDMKVRPNQFKTVKKFLQDKANQLEGLLTRYNNVIEKNNNESQQAAEKEIQNALKKIEDTLEEYSDVKAEEAIIRLIETGEDRIANLENRINKLSKSNADGYLELSPGELNQLREYLIPFSDFNEMINVVSKTPGFSDTFTEYDQRMRELVAKSRAIQDRTLDLERLYVTSFLSSLPNSPTYQDYKEKYQTEFEKQQGSTSFFRKNTVNGRKLTSKEYNNEMAKYVNTKLKENMSEIRAKEYERVKDVVERLPRDVNFLSYFIETGDINDDFIQSATMLIDERDYITLVKGRELADKYDEVMKEYEKEHKSTNQIKKYEPLLTKELDENGKPTGEVLPYLVSDYNASFYKHYMDKRIKVGQIEKERDAYDTDTDEYRDADKRYKQAVDDFATFKKENTVTGDNAIYPSAKWRTDIKLSNAEQKLYDFLLEQREETYKNYNNKQGDLNKNLMGLTFYKLPAVNKSLFERTAEGSMRGLLDTVVEKFTVQADDTGEYVEAGKTDDIMAIGDENNKLQKTIPIYYRRDTQDQSYDIMSTHLLDNYSSVRYKNHNMIRSTLEMMKNVAESRKVNETASMFGKATKVLKNVMAKNPDTAKLGMDGDQSREFEILKGLIDARIYGDRKWEKGKLAKVIDSMITMSSQSIMTANFFSAVPNVLVGKLNSFFESQDISGISQSALTEGTKFYWSDIIANLNDIGKIRPSSMTNILTEIFNQTGSEYPQYAEFAKNSKIKQQVNVGTGMFLTTSGEHFVQSSIMYGKLADTLLLNKDGKYLDKEGKPTDDVKKASSLLDYYNDMYDSDEGRLKKTSDTYSNALRTTFSDTKLGPELNTELSLYMRDVVVATQGLYASDWFTYADRFAPFRMFIALRGWMIPGLDKRFRGIGSTFSDNEADRNFYDKRRGSKKSGNYVDTIRFANKVKGKALKMKFDLMNEDWENLSPRERGNIRKSVLEISTFAAIFATNKILRALSEEEEEVDDSTLFTIYTLTRLQAEIGFYANPFETIKIMRSPAASLSMMEKILGLLNQATSDLFSMELERYERTSLKGTPKVKKKLFNVLPGFAQLNREVEKAIQYLDNPAIR